MASLIRRPNGVYYQVTTQNGKRVWRSTGARTQSAAIAAIHQGLVRNQPRRCVTVSQFFEEFLPYARTNLSASTVELYTIAVRNFVRLAGDKPMREYAAMDIERYKSRRAEEVGPVTLNIGFRNMKALFEMAVRWEVLEKNPFKGVKQVRVPVRRPVFLSKEEFARVLAAVPYDWLRAVVCFAVSTMMRAGEIVNLRWESVDLARRLIHVDNTETFRTKTTQPRTVPMNRWVYEYLRSQAATAGYVFDLPGGGRLTAKHASRMFKRAVRKAQLPDDIHFHSLRHTGASWLVQDGVSIFAVQKLLGHSSIQVTMIYSHLSPAELLGVVDRIQLPTVGTTASVTPPPMALVASFHTPEIQNRTSR